MLTQVMASISDRDMTEAVMWLLSEERVSPPSGTHIHAH